MEKLCSEAGYVLDRDFLDPRQHIYLFIIFFSDGYFVTQGKHGKGCSWRWSEKSLRRLYLLREVGDGSDWEAAECCDAWCLTVSNCCWHSRGLFWPRPALGTAEKLTLLEFSPFTIHSATWLQKSIKKKKKKAGNVSKYWSQGLCVKLWGGD